MTKRVTAPAGNRAHGAFNPASTGPHLWFVDGVSYVPDDSPHLRYFRNNGYGIEDDVTIPSEYTDRAARMESETTVHGTGDFHDGAEPDRRHNVYRHI